MMLSTALMPLSYRTVVPMLPFRVLVALVSLRLAAAIHLYVVAILFFSGSLRPSESVSVSVSLSLRMPVSMPTIVPISVSFCFPMFMLAARFFPACMAFSVPPTITGLFSGPLVPNCIAIVTIDGLCTAVMTR